MERHRLREVALAGIIAALYAVVTVALAPISFGVYQVRVAEALTILPFLSRAAVPGLFIGCLVANVYGGLGWQDIVFGSLLTLVAAALTRLVYHLSKRSTSYGPAVVPAVLMWAGCAALVADGWPGLAGVGMIILAPAVAVMSVIRLTRPGATKLAGALLGVLAVLITAVYALQFHPRWHDLAYILGIIGLAVALVFTFVITYSRQRGHNPAVFLAPLPPVLANGFGVSLYLAPIIGVNYWFSVQMVGLGELIACYVLGLPLLLLLERRRQFFD